MARYVKETSHIIIKPEKPELAGRPPSPQSITDAIEWGVNYFLRTGKTVTIVQEVKIGRWVPTEKRPEAPV